MRMFGVKKHSGQTLRLTSDFDRLSVVLGAGGHHVAGLLAPVTQLVCANMRLIKTESHL
jgi:hypothetical protein